MTVNRLCSTPDCAQPVVGRKLCRRHYQAAWKAGAFVNAPLPPRRRARTVCPAEHKHGGSSTCYIQHQCRCDPCTDLHSAMEKRRSRARAYGRDYTGLVEAEPVREHMMLLAEFGIGYKRAAGIAGIGVTAARTLIWGRQDPGPRYGELQKRVKRETAERLLAVKPDISNLAAGARIPARGTHRRVQALVARGWSQSKLSALTERERGNWFVMMQAQYVTVRFHQQVAAIYEDLWDREPPRSQWRDKIAYSRAVNYAKARRWLPPLAWDDIDTDVEPPVVVDGEAGVDDIAIDLAIHGEMVRLSSLERRQAITTLHAQRWSDKRIAETLHLADRTVLRIRQELGLNAFEFADLRQVGAA